MEIIIYRRYVDDINVIARMRKKDKNESVGDENLNDQESEEDREKEGMEFFKKIGDSIDKSIKLEIDYPSKHDDKKMPLLDVKVWMEDKECNMQVNQHDKEVQKNNKAFRYEHYRKSMASKM